MIGADVELSAVQADEVVALGEHGLDGTLEPVEGGEVGEELGARGFAQRVQRSLRQRLACVDGVLPLDAAELRVARPVEEGILMFSRGR